MTKSTECICAELSLARQVWAVDLVLYGVLPADLNVGEAWVSPASWLQLLGFSLLLAGTIIYAQVLASTLQYVIYYYTCLKSIGACASQQLSACLT